MRAFVTGGTGFIGRHVVLKLIARGHEVTGLARSEHSADELRALGAHPVIGNLLDRESMRVGMDGCDTIFHIAGWYKLGPYDKAWGEEINVTGTRNTLELASELGASRIIYTSTVAVYGDTHGQVVDETYQMPASQKFLNQYDRTKWKAHYEVAQPLIEAGVPVITVLPGAVYGPGDESLVGDLMKLFYKYPMPVFPVRDLALTFAHVEDIAEGHILAAEHGEPGENYILAGPVMFLPDMVKIWARITKRREPIVYLPANITKPFAPLAGYLESIIPNWPDLFSRDAISILDATYTASSFKTQKDLGWKTRDLEIGMRETFDWIGENVQPVAISPTQRRQIGITALGAVIGLLLIWLTKHQQSKHKSK